MAAAYPAALPPTAGAPAPPTRSAFGSLSPAPARASTTPAALPLAAATAIGGRPGPPELPPPGRIDFLRPPPLRSPVRAIVAAPLAAFLATSLGFALLWQSPLLPALLALLILSAALPVSMPPAHIKAGAAAAGVPLPLGVCLLGVTSGALAGIYANEAYVHPYAVGAFGRAYGDVLASAPGAAYADAGALRFAASSAVQTQLSLGYRSQPTYCVAPVADLDPAASPARQTRTISFWAVGTDCCGTQGRFSCGSGGAGGARGGLRLAADDGLFVRQRREFMRAVEQAAAAYDLVVDDTPILVHWTANAAAEQESRFRGALTVVAFGSVLFALASVAALGLHAAQRLGIGAAGRLPA